MSGKPDDFTKEELEALVKGLNDIAKEEAEKRQ